jgi:hypothetical protein
MLPRPTAPEHHPDFEVSIPQLNFRFSNNGITKSQITDLIAALAQDNCPIQNLFLDWNPIYDDSFKGGTPDASNNNLYSQTPEELSPFAQLVQDAKKLQVLFLRHSGLNDKDLKQICHLLKPESGVL